MARSPSLRSTNSLGEVLPVEAFEIEAPHPLEISGVASVADGYAVVGDEDPEFGRIWPAGTAFEIGGNLNGPESIAVGFGPAGEELWLILGEKRRTLIDLAGGRHRFSGKFREKEGRGLEGLAVKRTGGAWRVAMAWEGGFFDWKSDRAGEHAAPRIAVFTWIPGVGVGGRIKTVKVAAPKPSRGQRFGVPDLVWDGDDLIVLLASTDKRRKHKAHTWLQRFAANGRPAGRPFKLEDEWGAYRDGKNWEALDWTLDRQSLVMGHDAKANRAYRALVVFPKPAGL